MVIQDHPLNRTWFITQTSKNHIIFICIILLTCCSIQDSACEICISLQSLKKNNKTQPPPESKHAFSTDCQHREKEQRCFRMERKFPKRKEFSQMSVLEKSTNQHQLCPCKETAWSTTTCETRVLGNQLVWKHLKKMQGGNQQRQNNNHDEKVIKDGMKLFTL